MSQRLRSSGQTILDTVLECNDWSFIPLQGNGELFVWFVLVKVVVESYMSCKEHSRLPRLRFWLFLHAIVEWDGDASLHTIVEWDGDAGGGGAVKYPGDASLYLHQVCVLSSLLSPAQRQGLLYTLI